MVCADKSSVNMRRKAGKGETKSWVITRREFWIFLKYFFKWVRVEHD